MREVFTLYRRLHERRLELLNSFTPEKLATISAGFKNSILWNIARCVVTQQLYCYANSDLPTYLSNDFIAKYRKDIVSNGHIPTTTEIEEVRNLMFSTLGYLEVDYAKGIFRHYNHYLTGTEYPLTNIDETIYFNISHKGVHLGSVLALKYAAAKR